MIRITDTLGATGHVEVTVLEHGEIVHHDSVSNRITIGLDEHLARAINPNAATQLDSVEWWEVGIDDTAPQYSNEDLNDMVYSSDLVSVETDGTALEIVSFLDTTEANGHDLTEGGLRSENGSLFNHATYNQFSKTETREVIFDITLTFDSQ